MLDLRIGPGRRNVDLTVQVVRGLVPADLVLLAGERGTKPIAIKALRERHHSIARLIAEGRHQGEVAAITGYTQSRISILLTDPTFAELVAFYKREIDVAYVDLHTTLAGMALDAAQVLRERLEDNPEDVSDTKL